MVKEYAARISALVRGCLLFAAILSLVPLAGA
jgi:hypothetical protein